VSVTLDTTPFYALYGLAIKHNKNGLPSQATRSHSKFIGGYGTANKSVFAGLFMSFIL